MLEEKLHASRVAALYSIARPAYAGGVAVGGMLLVVLWDLYPGWLLVAWFAALCAVMLARIGLHLAYVHARRAAERPGLWENRFALGALASGALWAYVPAVFVPHGQELVEAAIIILGGGVIMAGTALSAASPRAVYALALLPLASTAIELVRQPDGTHRLLAVAILLFGFVMSRMSREMHRSLVGALRGKLENERLLAEEEFVLDTLPVGVAFIERQAVTRCNRRFEQILGYGSGELTGRSTRLWFTSDERWKAARDESHRRMADGGIMEGDARLVRKDGSRVWCRVQGRSADPHAPDKPSILTFIDIEARIASEKALKESEEKLRFLADHDSLTGLPNRRLLEDRLRQAVLQARRRGSKAAAMLIDLDDFKRVNDSAGHRAGDAVLREVATRLAGCVRKADTLARHGGDEFVVVLADVQSESDARTVAEKILRALEPAFATEGKSFGLGASIGISIFPGDAGDAEALLRNADAAMYRAKQLGRNRYGVYAG